MKTNYIFYILILCITMMSCDNLSEKEKNAQKYMEQIATNTNNMMKLPAKVDEFTFAEKVKFDKNTNTIIYSYIINKSDYGSESDFKKIFKQIENEQFKRAKENQGEDPNYKTLGVTIKSIYKNKKKDILYSFDITPKDYLKSELLKKEKTKNRDAYKLFSNEKFNLELKNGTVYNLVEERNNVTNKYKEKFKKVGVSTSLILETDIKNPFNEIIEQTDISIEIILKYKIGEFKFKSKKQRGYLSEKDKLSDFDISDFTKNDSLKLKELQRYSDYLNLNRENWSRTNKDDKEDLKQLEEENKFNTEVRYKFSKKDLVRLKSELEEFEDYFDKNQKFNYFTDSLRDNYFPNFLNTKSIYCFRLFKDFKQINNSDNLKRLPTLNKFNAEKVEVNIYLTASNTNGYYFANTIKNIDITELWNNHYVKNQNL